MNNLALSAEAIALSVTPATTERHAITSREQWLGLRSKDITASTVAALFGEYAYFGRLGLWEQKTGRAPDVDTSTRAMRRGNQFEALALEELADERPTWRVSPLGNRWYFRDRLHRLGATPDAFAYDPAREGFGVVQVKSAVNLSKGKWLDEHRQPFCPTWVGLQALTEAILTGASWAVVVVIVVDSEDPLMVIDVPLDLSGLWPTITNEVDLFWQTIAEGRVPEIDPVRDGRVVSRVFAEDNGEEIDLTSDNRIAEIVAERERLKAIEADGGAAAKERKIIDTEILGKLGHAASARIPGGATITAKTVRRGGYTVAPTSYRTIKVTGGSAPAASAKPARTAAVDPMERF